MNEQDKLFVAMIGITVLVGFIIGGSAGTIFRAVSGF